MKLKTMLAAAAIAASATTAIGVASAQDQAVTLSDVIEMRQRVMMANEQAARIIVGMLRNQIPFEATVVASLMSTIGHDNAIFPSLLIAGTETGSGTFTQRATEVAPAVWTDLAGFVDLSQKMVDATTAAGAAAAGDRTAFITAFRAVSDGCTACHEKYRVEKE